MTKWRHITYDFVAKYESATLLNSDTFVPDKNGVPVVKLDSTFTSLDEVQLLYQFLDDNDLITTYKEEISLSNPINRMYYDINEYPNDIDLYLTIKMNID